MYAKAMASDAEHPDNPWAPGFGADYARAIVALLREAHETYCAGIHMPEARKACFIALHAGPRGPRPINVVMLQVVIH